MKKFSLTLAIMLFGFHAFAGIETLDSLEDHQKVLRNAFLTAKRKIVISSPQMSIDAIKADDIVSLITEANNREKNNGGVKVVIYTDKDLDKDKGKKDGSLKPNTESAFRELMKLSNVRLKVVEQLHAKILIVDDREISSGSFNWLGATRDTSKPYFRYEHTFRLTDESVGSHILKALLDLKTLEIKTDYKAILFNQVRLVNENRQPVTEDLPRNIRAAKWAIAKIIYHAFYCTQQVSEEHEHQRFISRVKASYLLRNLAKFTFSLRAEDKDAFFSFLSSCYTREGWIPVVLQDTFSQSADEFLRELLNQKRENESSQSPQAFPIIKVEKVDLQQALNKHWWPFEEPNLAIN